MLQVIALLSHSQQHMQEGTQQLATTAVGLELKINTSKTQIMWMNNKNTNPITIRDLTLEEVRNFTEVC